MDEAFLLRVPPSGVYVETAALQWGADCVREPYTLPATDQATALQLPPLPRDGAGTPLEVQFPAWRPGNVLRVRWAASAVGVLSPGAGGVLVPLVSLAGGAFRYLDNGAQIGLVGVPGVLVYAFGEAAIQLDHQGPVAVRLGIALVAGAPGDALAIQGGPLTYVPDPPNTASTWLYAERFSAAGVVSLPPASLAPTPIPS